MVGEQRGAARRKAYAEITDVVMAALARYLEEFPERAGDERHKDAVAWSPRGVDRVFRVLNKYEITEKPPPPPKKETPQ